MAARRALLKVTVLADRDWRLWIVPQQYDTKPSKLDFMISPLDCVSLLIFTGQLSTMAEMNFSSLPGS